MAFAFVQAQSAGTNGTSATTIAVTVTAVGAGNLVAGVLTWGGATTDLISVTDNKSGGSNSYTIVRRVLDSPDGQCAASFYGYNLSGGPTVITANFSSAVPYRGISVEEFSGSLTASDPLDGANEQGQLQASPGTGANGAKSGAGNLTPSQNNCLIWGGSVDTGALNAGGSSEFAAGTNFTEPANAEYITASQISLSSEYWIQTTATAANASFTVTQNSPHITFMMVFKDTSGAGGTVNTATLTDNVAVIDGGLPSIVKPRTLSDSVVVTEGTTVVSTIYGFLFGDDLTVTDQMTGYPVRGRLGESAIIVDDGAVFGAIRNQLLQSAIAVTDELLSSVIGSSILTKILTSNIDVTDGAVLSIIRGRLLQDTIILSEGLLDTFINRNIVADDTIDVTDSIVTRLLLTRLLGDSIDLADSAIASIIGQNVISAILSSTIQTSDEALRFMLRGRVEESATLTADEVIKVLRFTRELTDAIDAADQSLSNLQRFILLTDALAVDDAFVSLLTTPTTANPVIRIGFDQPRIDIGGYSV
jgi:hypothetical protein